MNEMTADVLRIMEDLQRMQYKKQQNGVGEAAEDAYGFPFEPYDAFSTKPLEFAETAMRLDIEAREMFGVLRTMNRFSPLYYQLSGQFEKLVKQLGSCCITKAVLEQQENDTFELLQDLSIDSLREMTAFNFRKCFAAFTDSRSRGKINTAAFAFSIRWAALDKRLIATSEKIRNQKSEIRNAALKAPGDQYPVLSTQLETVSDDGAGCSEAQNCAGENRHHCHADDNTRDLPVSAFAEKSRAFPVDRQIRNKKSEIRNTALSMLGNHYAVPGTQQSLDVGNGAGCPETPDGVGGNRYHGHTTEDKEKQFMRQILMGEALNRGDREAYETVRQTPDAELEALWQEFLRRDMRNGFPFLEKLSLFGAEPEDPPPEMEDWKEEALLPEFAVT